MKLTFKLRRYDAAWEVVDQAEVEPIFMYDEDEDFDIERVGDNDVFGTYIFDVKKDKHLPNTLWHSRRSLLADLEDKGFNVLLYEGWRLTLFRKGKKHRVEVRYVGRPAHVLGKLPSIRPPPFLALLDNCRFT